MSLLPPEAVEFIGFVAPRHTSEIHPAEGRRSTADYLKLLAQAHEGAGSTGCWWRSTRPAPDALLLSARSPRSPSGCG